MTDKQAIKTLDRLHRLCKAGERGFRTTAENVRNLGLKVLFRTHAHNRGQCAAELEAEIKRLGGDVSGRRSMRGIIHRGRIDITASLAIRPERTEQVVLKEAALGEEAVVRAYQEALEKELPSKTRSLVQEQYEKILTASEQVQLLQGMPGDQMVVQLFDNDQEVEQAIHSLQEAGFPREAIETTLLSHPDDLYKGEGSTLDETVLSGALGGAIWGSVLGTASGLGVLLVPNMMPLGVESATGLWALIALTGVIIGALFGAILGFVIKISLSEEDAYIYQERISPDSKLLKLHTNRQRASEASQIMNRIEKTPPPSPAVNAA